MATKTENTNIADIQKHMFGIECCMKKAETPEDAIRLFEKYQQLSAELRTAQSAIVH